jgi:hypothetical protein
MQPSKLKKKKKNEIDWGMEHRWVKWEVHTTFWAEPRERWALNETILYKWILKELDVMMWSEWNLLSSEPVKGPSGHDGEPYFTYLLRGLSLQANYTDRATAACRRS